MHLGSIERDPIRLADWAELQILYSGSTGISIEAIRTETDVEGFLEDDDQLDVSAMSSEVSERHVADAVREINRRAAHAGKGYPFRIQGDRLELRPGIHRWTPYAFCLMICDRDYWNCGDPSPKMFEHVASSALQAYLQGSAIRFGSPRDEPEQQIKVALQCLSERTGDRLLSGFPVRATDKDLGLDVVGWKDFDDRQISKVLVYMQCATGEDWPRKKGDLDLSMAGVWSNIMRWTTPPVKAMAIPYIVPPGDEWERETSGLLFMDRLRISSVLPARSVSAGDFDWLGWFKSRVAVASERQGLSRW